jgi:hypothetical protein
MRDFADDLNFKLTTVSVSAFAIVYLYAERNIERRQVETPVALVEDTTIRQQGI